MIGMFSTLFGLGVVQKSTLRVLKVVIFSRGLEQSYAINAMDLEIWYESIIMCVSVIIIFMSEYI